MKLLNTLEKKAWMNERMKLGHSFEYIKGLVDGHDGKINIGVRCIETDEFFQFNYFQLQKN